MSGGRCAVTVAALMLGAAPVFGCPLCESDAGRRVRTGLFDDVGHNLLIALVPFVALLALAALILFGPRRPTRSGTDG